MSAFRISASILDFNLKRFDELPDALVR